MSIFYFKILCLGDPDTLYYYMSAAFDDTGEDKETYFAWFKELKVVEDKCDLEIDAITSISADLDDIIPMADGIVYFINPLIKEESELLEIILPIVYSAKRDIPTVIIFYDQNGILPISVNELLENIWVNYPSLEAFVNLNPKEFHQAIQSLCLAMINGDTPLNIENAWMRFPIFIQMANIYFTEKNYYYAAQAVKKASLIAEIYDKEEYFIICEQAAYLYSKINLYLEASKILEKVDSRKSSNFKKLYAEALIREGNLFFNREEYENAAIQYERAAQWSSIELLDKALILEAFKLAINSWISASKIENAFRILENLPHNEVITILREISNKIEGTVDYLVGTNNLELAREQANLSIKKYQREGLFEELQNLTLKFNEILIVIFNQQISDKDIYGAKNTYDDLENIWNTGKVEKVNLDSNLNDLINLFLQENNFSTATILINKLNSMKLKQELTKFSSEVEEKYKASKKRKIEENIKKGIHILKEFFDTELNIIAEINSQKIKEANEFVKENNYLQAAIHLNEQSLYLKDLGKDDISDQILSRSLDLLLEGLIFEEFFISFENLSKDMKKRYLTRNFPIYLQRLKDLEDLENYEKKEKIMENSNKIYRNQMLYDESKEISLLFIKIIKTEALKVLQREENISGISRASELVRKILDISSSYLEKEEQIKITFNKIYKKIAEIYIELDDLPSAHAFNDKIEKKEYKTEIHKKIAELEAQKSSILTKKARDSYKEGKLKESLSIIRNKAQEALIDKDNEFKERKALKRVYFEDSLIFIKNHEFDKAFEIYKKNISQLKNLKKYKLASLCLAIAVLLLMKENRIQEVDKLIEEKQKELSQLWKLFSETFPITLILYIIGLRKLHDESKFKEGLSYFKNLPLFEEELKLVYDLMEKEYQKETEIETFTESELNVKDIKKTREEIGESSRLRVFIDQNFGKIQSKLSDIQREAEELLNKRKAMKKRYYKKVLELLKAENYRDAAQSYFDLAKSIYKRKDFTTCSLLILLYGLSSLKYGESYEVIKKEINEFLNNLGINKELLRDTFYIMLILFLINIKINKFDKFLSKVKVMFEVLPLFEEEKVLIKIE